jgi:hypothetical protein
VARGFSIVEPRPQGRGQAMHVMRAPSEVVQDRVQDRVSVGQSAALLAASRRIGLA